MPNVAVALTAEEAFWDTGRELVFLGPWCLRHSRREAWEPLGGRLAPDPWDRPEARRAAYDRVQATCETLLPPLAAAFDGMHATALGERGWRILLWPWLVRYVAVMLDRSERLAAAREAFPGATFVGLAAQDFRTPGDTLGLIQALKTDRYNLQLMTAILTAMGAEVEERRGEWQPEPAPAVARSPLRKLLTATGSMAPLQARNTFLSRPGMLRLQAALGGRLADSVAPLLRLPDAPLARSAERDALVAGVEPGDDLVELVVRTLPGDVPRCFVEESGTVRRWADEWYARRARATWSANAWYFDEPFKLRAAERAAAGGLLLGMQHGGGYGCLEMHAGEAHERTISDRYYSWGWTEPGTVPVVPMPATKLIDRAAPSPPETAETILFVVTAEPRYLIEFPLTPELSLAQIGLQQRFAASLGEELRGRLTVRLHYEDMGWDLAERWHEAWPEVALERADSSPFAASLGRSRLYVCDHLSTTFLESLAANHPTVLYWDPATYPLREPARPHFEALGSAGVLHASPEAAAAKVADVYDDVATWWRSAEVQHVRREFCRCYARTSDRPIEDWAAELRGVLEASC